MDPFAVVTAAIGLATEGVRAWEKFYDGASPEQKIQIVQIQIDRDKWWRDFFDRITPKAQP